VGVRRGSVAPAIHRHNGTPVATRRSKKRHAGHSGGPETAEQMLDRVLGAFDRWQGEREPDPKRYLEVTDIVRTACELKSSYLGESNPAEWNPEIAVEVVGQVIPRKVVDVDEDYARSLVPAMQTFVEFLVVTGRWKPHNDASATRTALSALEPELPGRFNDPDRLTMAGRIMQVALDEGVDIAEPGALDGFMQRFNDMPYEWRKRLTDAPGMPGWPDDLGFGGPDDNPDDELWDYDGEPGLFDGPDVLEILGAASATGIAAIGFAAQESVPITVPDPRSELSALLATPLLTRMTSLTEWVRPGRKITSTGAMRRADTAEWVHRFGVASGDGVTPNSMWDWPELAVPWSIAAACGLIDNSGGKARPGPNAAIFQTADLPAQILCARDAVDTLIDGLIDAGEELSELDMAVIGVLLALLAGLCRPDGADLSALRSLARPGVDPADLSESISRILFVMVVNIVDMLEAWGFVSTVDGRSSVPPALRPAIVEAIYADGAPFTFRLEPGAIPVEE